MQTQPVVSLPIRQVNRKRPRRCAQCDARAIPDMPAQVTERSCCIARINKNIHTKLRSEIVGVFHAQNRQCLGANNGFTAWDPYTLIAITTDGSGTPRTVTEILGE